MVAPINSLLRKVVEILIKKIQQDMKSEDLGHTYIKRTNSSFIRTTAQTVIILATFLFSFTYRNFYKISSQGFSMPNFLIAQFTRSVLNNKPIQPSKTYIFSIR